MMKKVIYLIYEVVKQFPEGGLINRGVEYFCQNRNRDMWRDCKKLWFGQKMHELERIRTLFYISEE